MLAYRLTNARPASAAAAFRPAHPLLSECGDVRGRGRRQTGVVIGLAFSSSDLLEEPSLDEIFADPIVGLLLRRDSLKPDAVRARLEREARRLRAGTPQRRPLHGYAIQGKAPACDRMGEPLAH